MSSNVQERYLHNYIVKNAVYTVAYLGALLLFLMYCHIIFDIGRYKCFPAMVYVIIAECLKLKMFPGSEYLNLRDSKSSKVKKHRYKDKLMEFLKCSVLIIAMVMLYFILSVLFGAAIFENHEETLMFSLLLGILTVVPSCLNFGSNCTISLLIDLMGNYRDTLVSCAARSIRLTLFGAWAGAIFIPLDWDREWQIWPIPCSLGAIAGYAYSNLLNLLCVVPSLSVGKTGNYGL